MKALERLRRWIRGGAVQPTPAQEPLNQRGATMARLNRQLAAGELGWPPGHFYSPVPDLVDVWQREEAIFRAEKQIPGINLDPDHQLKLLERLATFYPAVPFGEQQQAGLRYYFNNSNFAYGESIVLYCMMRLLQPRRIIEIGSGYSSCAILDINELAFDFAIDCTFIEPFPEFLLGLVKPGDRQRFRLLECGVQDVGLDLFSQLSAGDILFVDSSHISKIGSDVNHILFQILPRLQSGVYVHFHDVMQGFEYPREWIYQGRIWNEAYLLRAFLQYNEVFSVEFFNAFIGEYHWDALSGLMPLAARNPGTSLWLKRGG
jgi:hypothetical protein